MLRFSRQLAYLIILGLFMIGCASEPKTEQKTAPNNVVEFLSGAERQTETADDRLKVMQALDDMLALTADSLRARRYADYQGNTGVWTITTLLERYFNPGHPMALDTTVFFSDYLSADARALIERHLSEVKVALQGDSIE